MKKVALITGGSRGIGYGIALQLAKAGYDLVINGVREADAVAVQVKELESLGARVLYCRANISSDRMIEPE
jgi:NAD(P)-dependent dehydrogenase (short-subunit alcohol dehydrogenase family)